MMVAPAPIASFISAAVLPLVARTRETDGGKALRNDLVFSTMAMAERRCYHSIHKTFEGKQKGKKFLPACYLWRPGHGDHLPHHSFHLGAIAVISAVDCSRDCAAARFVLCAGGPIFAVGAGGEFAVPIIPGYFVGDPV